MSLIKHLVIFLSLILVPYEASRILAVFPTPSVSHQVAFRPLILELVKRGHEVVMLTTDPIFKKGEGPANLTEIDVHDVSYKIWREELVNKKMIAGSRSDLKGQVQVIMDLMEKVFEMQLQTDEMKSILNDKSIKFDLLILEAYMDALWVFTHIFKDVPVVQISSLGPLSNNVKTFGAPVHPLLYPTSFQQKVNNLTIWDKISQLYHNYCVESILNRFHDRSTELLRKVVDPNMPTLRELEKNVDLLLLNIHPLWEKNRPFPPNVIFMGGIHQKPQKELPQDLQEYLDSSKHGVIYVSFGTNVEPALLPPEKLQALTDAFSKLPYDILWKWNRDQLPGKSDNIKIAKWLPQSDLLRHPKVKLFIMQGGLQSTDESISAGVPLIGMPMLGDQWFNVEHFERNKIGLAVFMDSITSEKIINAVETVLNDTSYRENILRLRSIMHDQPETPLERATWWTEYVIRHKGAKHLKSPAAGMPLTQYLELELVLYIFLFVILAVITLGYAVLKFCSVLYRILLVSKKVKIS